MFWNLKYGDVPNVQPEIQILYFEVYISEHDTNFVLQILHFEMQK